jgi:hypothetical protein
MSKLNVNIGDLARFADAYQEIADQGAKISPQAAAELRRFTESHGAIGSPIAAGIAAGQLSTHHNQDAPSDCLIVRNMISYNKFQGKAIADAFHPEQDHEARVSDYQQWADHLHGDAYRIRSADLAARAHRLADDATQMVDLIKQIRSDTTAPADPDAPPSWAQPYAELNKQFRAELQALNQACPE